MNMFNKVPIRRPKRSTFQMNEDRRTTMQMGYLYPVLMKECLPGDTWEGSTEMLVRLNPLIGPAYEQIQVFYHIGFVPNRLLYEDWEKMISGGRLGPGGTDPETPPVPPQFNIQGVRAVDPTVFLKGKLSDHLGVPLLEDMPDAPHPVDWTNAYLDCMPYAAYQRFWFDYFRDRNFVSDEVFGDFDLPLPSGNVDADFGTFADWIAQMMTLRPRCYRHEYFTSALPWPQRGAEVMIPSVVNYLDQSLVKNTDGSSVPAGLDNTTFAGGIGETDGFNYAIVADPFRRAARLENIESVGPLVNDWRTAYALQVWLEKNAMAGSRYVDVLEVQFGVQPQDARLQRAEYIGGGLLPIRIQEVVSTAWAQDEEPAAVPQGNLAGYGIAVGNNNRFRWFCAEHGFIVGVVSIINPPSYHQGLPRMFKRRTFLDYPFPTFAKLGEQPVYNYEIYASSFNLADPAAGADYPVWGYQSRYADWKTGRNTNHGDFHDTLLTWCLTFDFGITPVLSENFTQFDPTIEERIFAAPLVDNFIVYLHHGLNVKRPLPYFGIPNSLGFS